MSRQHKIRSDAGCVRPGSTTARILAALTEHGRMCYEQLAEEVGGKVGTVRWALSRRNGDLWHICRWERGNDVHAKPRALWALGPPGRGGGVPRRPERLSSTERSRRYRGRQDTVVSSVWALGIRRDDRRVVA